MESEEKLLGLYLLFLIWLHVSADPLCGQGEVLQGGDCQPCPVCQDGQELSTVCGYGHGAGAECVLCPPHHYSNSGSNRRCTPCTNCTHLNAEFAQVCSPGTAAVCGRCLPGHYEEFRHCHSCALAPPDHRYCRQWLSDQRAAGETTPQPGSEEKHPTQSVVIPVVSSVCGVVAVLVTGGLIIVCVSRKWKCSSCKSSRRKDRVPQSAIPEVNPLLTTGCSPQQAIPDQPTAYRDDTSVVFSNGSVHLTSVIHDNQHNNRLANGNVTEMRTKTSVTEHIANGNIAPGHVANWSIASGHVANGNIAPGYVANGNIAPVHVANGNIAPVHVANGNIAPGHWANENIPSGHMVNGAISAGHVGGTQIEETPFGGTETLVTDSENLLGAEPYTSLPSSDRPLLHPDGSAVGDPSPLTSGSSSMVSATPGNSLSGSSPALLDHSIHPSPAMPAQPQRANDPASSAVPYGIQNYHSAETLPIRDDVTSGQPIGDDVTCGQLRTPFERAPLVTLCSQNVTSRSLVQRGPSSLVLDDSSNLSSSSNGTSPDNRYMEDGPGGILSAADVSSVGRQVAEVSPKSLVPAQSAGPLLEADGAPSTDCDQSEQAEPNHVGHITEDGTEISTSTVGRDHSCTGGEQSAQEPSRVTGQETEPKTRAPWEGRGDRVTNVAIVEVPQSQGSNRQVMGDELQELKNKASMLQTGVKIGELDPDTRENLALLLDPEPSALGVHKTWRHFARHFNIEEKFIRNWHGLLDVLLYLETSSSYTVPDVIQAVYEINRLDALEELCRMIIEKEGGRGEGPTLEQ